MRTSLLAAAVLLLVVPACQSRSLTGVGTDTTSSGGGGDEAGWHGSGPQRAGQVALSARDLEPVDRYVDAGADQRNTRWIVGDEVLVEASREYFAQIASISARPGAVLRTDEVKPDEHFTTLTFVMGHNQSAVENNPRVMIGSGITVSARKVLKVRLFRTTDASTPVRLRITATGEASRGKKDVVEQRSPSLQMGGVLRRGPQGWAWQPLG
jgi:hypothetical protein